VIPHDFPFNDFSYNTPGDHYNKNKIREEKMSKEGLLNNIKNIKIKFQGIEKTKELDNLKMDYPSKKGSFTFNNKMPDFKEKDIFVKDKTIFCIYINFSDPRQSYCFENCEVHSVEEWEKDQVLNYEVKFKAQETPLIYKFDYDEKVIDFRGKKIFVGNQIAYPSRKGASMSMKQGTVVDILKKKNFLDEEVFVLSVMNTSLRKVEITNITNVVLLDS
jgi:hypothetical protein